MLAVIAFSCWVCDPSPAFPLRAWPFTWISSAVTFPVFVTRVLSATGCVKLLPRCWFKATSHLCRHWMAICDRCGWFVLIVCLCWEGWWWQGPTFPSHFFFWLFPPFAFYFSPLFTRTHLPLFYISASKCHPSFLPPPTHVLLFFLMPQSLFASFLSYLPALILLFCLLRPLSPSFSFLIKLSSLFPL